MAKLYFYYSTMNAGKSTALLQASHNYEERGMRTLLYTALIDSRDDGRIALAHRHRPARRAISIRRLNLQRRHPRRTQRRAAGLRAGGRIAVPDGRRR